MIGRFGMKKVVLIVIFLSIFFSGCVPATTEPALTNTASVSETPTRKPIPTSHFTFTPPPPTATFSPIEAIPNTSNSFTLTESNAGTEMKLLNTIGTGTAYDIKFSPDGKNLAVATGRGIFLYGGMSFEQTGFIEMDNPVSAIAFSPDGETLALAMSGKISLVNKSSGQKIMDLDGELFFVYKLVYGVGGYVAAIGGTCGACDSPQAGVILWDVKTGSQVFFHKNIWFTTIALEFTPDGKQLIFGGGGISIIDTKTGKEIALYNEENSPLVSAAIDAPYNIVLNDNGTRLFVSSVETSTEIFDLNKRTHTSFPLCEIYITGNGKIGACSKGQKILIFDLKNGNELQSIDIDVDSSSLVDMFVLSPDGKFLVYYGTTGINVINLTTKENFAEIDLTDFGIAKTGIIEIDGTEKYTLATLTYSGQVKIYDLQTGELIRRLKSDCCEIKGFNFAPDRKTFATIEEKLLGFWDLQSGNLIYEIELERDYSGPIAFSPDGSHIFLTDLIENYIVELDLQSGNSTNQGRNIYSYGDPFAVNNYNFNYLGNLMILKYENSNQQSRPSFMDIKTKEKIVLPIDINIDFDFLEAFSFSPDGRYLTTYGNGVAYVWGIP